MDFQTDGEGFLANRAEWTEEVACEIASRDGVELNELHLKYIAGARRMFEENGVVPPLRGFVKQMGIDKKELYDAFMTGPMKLICKWGGLPKPTGCV
ncbi:MAG: TusE/DsrC/DsvC family sulfur relay protein [Rhodospirillaceae bacterium]|nr:TusE/DsrC/DsvC family sulfur relay protein [Rhodospirillaceae bacterium]MCK5546443.1 TusE/DsrC/DsvC family sulfur relay protein [Rhodospirillaceae bacterium]